MGKADEERLAIGAQKYLCLYDKSVSAFHNKNQKKNALEAVAKDGFTIMSLSFDFGAIVIFLFGLILWF